MVDSTERTDGALAPVTYLFGTGAGGAGASAVTNAGAAEVEDSAEPAWATPGVEHSATASTQPVGPAAPAKGSVPAADTKRAHNVGLHALTRRGQSVAEMTKLLESRELEPEVVEAEIKRLKSVGLLDDFDLADTLVRTLSERKKLGKSAIASELRQRKINPVAIDAALEQLDGDDELARATEVAVKRAGQLSSYDQETTKRRLSAFLQRRGYSGSVLSGAMAAALNPASRSTGGPRFE